MRGVMGSWRHVTSVYLRPGQPGQNEGRRRGQAALTGPDLYPRVKRVLTYPGGPGTRTERAQS